MKDTSYKQPLWSNTTSNEDTMYKAWEVQENDWDQVKWRRSRSLEAESFPATRKSERSENQVLFSRNERTGMPSHSTSNEDINTETEAMVRPRFQITIERPIRHITPAGNASFSQWSKLRTARRASDGILASARYSGSNTPAFSALSEEHDTEDSETGSIPTATNNVASRASSLNCRRFSDGCFHSVSRYTGSKKVSIVLPQPRRSSNQGSKTCGGKETTCEGDDVKNMESADCSRNEEDDRWKELVAKAQGFKGAKMNGVGKFRGLYVEDVKGVDINRSLDMEDVLSDNSSEASFSSNSSYHSSSDSDSAVYSALATKPISGDLAHFREVSRTISNSTSRIARRASAEHSLDSYSSKNQPRRYSVASFSSARTLNPAPTAKLSGYSTQSALEQARQLLGKLQLEGKNKSKKERLEELSSALKWILEELNRIETPDRDLVSLFISLRAKIVHLKNELKAEEFDATCIDPSEVDSAPLIQKRVLTEGNFAHTCSRRFSWC